MWTYVHFFIGIQNQQRVQFLLIGVVQERALERPRLEMKSPLASGSPGYGVQIYYQCVACFLISEFDTVFNLDMYYDKLLNHTKINAENIIILNIIDDG